jgi:hypothetical protein
MGSLFKRPDPPDKPKPVLMPDPDSPVIRNTEENRRRQIASRSGRTSTMLTRPEGMGGAYRNSLLGQAG